LSWSLARAHRLGRRMARVQGGAQGRRARSRPRARRHGRALDFGGLSIERFYHFICKSDQATLDLMTELGIAHRIRWRATSKGYYIDGKLYKWGDPLALLSFRFSVRSTSSATRGMCSWRPSAGLVRAREFQCTRLDRFASRREDLEPAVEAQLRSQVLRACGLGVSALARRSDQAIGRVPPVDLPGGARLHRRRHGGAGWSPRQGHRGKRWQGALPRTGPAGRDPRWKRGRGAHAKRLV